MTVGGRTGGDRGDRDTLADNVNDLVLDLLEWLGSGPRPYAEVLDAWRTSCPRLPVWEEATDRGFVERVTVAGHGQCVAISAAGTEHLRQARPRGG
jgi:D-3-phosphoglycerate dehydrogenase / 2-oxoglutarate reductase